MIYMLLYKPLGEDWTACKATGTGCTISAPLTITRLNNRATIKINGTIYGGCRACPSKVTVTSLCMTQRWGDPEVACIAPESTLEKIYKEPRLRGP